MTFTNIIYILSTLSFMVAVGLFLRSRETNKFLLALSPLLPMILVGVWLVMAVYLGLGLSFSSMLLIGIGLGSSGYVYRKWTISNSIVYITAVVPIVLFIGLVLVSAQAIKEGRFLKSDDFVWRVLAADGFGHHEQDPYRYNEKMLDDEGLKYSVDVFHHEKGSFEIGILVTCAPGTWISGGDLSSTLKLVVDSSQTAVGHSHIPKQYFEEKDGQCFITGASYKVPQDIPLRKETNLEFTFGNLGTSYRESAKLEIRPGILL